MIISKDGEFTISKTELLYLSIWIPTLDFSDRDSINCVKSAVVSKVMSLQFCFTYSGTVTRRGMLSTGVIPDSSSHPRADQTGCDR